MNPKAFSNSESLWNLEVKQNINSLSSLAHQNNPSMLFETLEYANRFLSNPLFCGPMVL